VPTADELLGREVVLALRDVLLRTAPDASLSALTACADGLAGLALGERSAAIRDATLAGLPQEYDAFDAAIRVALQDEAFDGWMIWAVADAVAVRALEHAGDRDFSAGLELLRALTPRLTAEAAIRRFLLRDPDRALAHVATWTTDADEHVRRLVSEGTRPFLPWAVRVPALVARPEATVPLLDALHRDPAEYVRRSVANHLNDLSRLDPALVTDVAGRWLDGAPGDVPTRRLARHALRTLVKKGDPRALELQGFAPPPGDLAVTGPVPEVAALRIGDELAFTATLEHRGPEPVELAIDYVVHYVKASGSTTPKVFKLTTRTVGPGERVTLRARRSFVQRTTRRHHPGVHVLELQVNGRRYGRAEVELLP
jgi:3-methyladenine DNA glycosylase AlkC